MRRLSTLAVHLTVLAICALMFPASLVQAQNETLGFLDSKGIDSFDRCGKRQFWPSNGTFQTTGDGDEYGALLRFQLTQEEKDALMCVDDYLELDFRLLGLNAPKEWDNYSVSTDVPGGVHDTAKDDKENDATPGITGIKVSDLTVNHEYYASIHFSGLSPNGDGAPRVAIEWVSSYWASPGEESAKPEEIAFCTAYGYLGAPMCVFGNVRVYLSNGYTADKDGKGQGLVFDGYRFWEFSDTAAAQVLPTIEPAQLPTVADSMVCNDYGIPQITDGLSYSPANPDTTTPVEFKFTITNTGCGTFQAKVLAIGGRDPNGTVTDPLQIPDFTLGPNESQEFTQTAILSTPGTHEFFMAFLAMNDHWNPIPDASGAYPHIYIDVTDTGAAQINPPVDDSNQSSSCVEGAVPVVTSFTSDGADAYAVDTAPVYYTIEIQNRGCETWDPGYIQVYDYVTGYGLYSAQQEVVEPGNVLVIENFNYFETVGTHTLYITADNGGVLVDESGAEANLDISVVDVDG